MSKLNQKQINSYLKKTGKNVLSSVGCYQVEKLGPQIIKTINGDFFNVLGFPLFPFLTFWYFNESMFEPKTMMCVLLSFVIVGIQVFWK